MIKKFGNRIYFDKYTGEIILIIAERQGDIKVTTIEQDIESHQVLSERNRESFDVIELEYGQYAQDFAESNGYRVNPETKTLEFSYTNPNVPPEEQEPVYQKPLSEEIQELKVAQATTDSTVLELMETILLGGM